MGTALIAPPRRRRSATRRVVPPGERPGPAARPVAAALAAPDAGCPPCPLPTPKRRRGVSVLAEAEEDEIEPSVVAQSVAKLGGVGLGRRFRRIFAAHAVQVSGRDRDMVEQRGSRHVAIAASIARRHAPFVAKKDPYARP